VLNDKLKIGSTFNYSMRESRASVQGYIWSADVFRAAQTPGNIPAYFPNSTKGYQETDPLKIGYFVPGDLYQNAAVIFDDFSNPVHNVASTLYAELEIIKGLNFKTLYGQNFTQNFRRNYTEQSMNPEGNPAKLDVSSNRNASTSVDNTLTFDRKIGSFNVNAMAGTSIVNMYSNRLQADRTGYPEGDPEGLRYLGFGAAASVVNSETASNVRLASYFGRVNLNYDEKYLLTASVRRDGSSRFHPDVRWGVFPSVSLGWRISEESFMKSIDWLDLLKIRGSWGQVGNQNVGSDYAYVSTVQSGTVNANNIATDQTFGLPLTRATGKVIWQRGNQKVTWETTTMANVGVDFGINKVNGTLEVFQNNTDDILLPANNPDIAGYFIGATQRVNAGKIQTSGLELSLNYGDKKGDFGYNIGANFTYSENEIVSLSANKFITGGSSNFKQVATSMSRAYVGDPIGSFYGFQTDGIFNTQAEVDAANANARDKAKQRAIAAGKPLTDAQAAAVYFIAAKTGPGDYKFKDNDGNGMIGDDDKANLGSGTPKIQFGLNFSCDYKAFDLALNMIGVGGVQIFSMLEPGLSDPSKWTKLTSVIDHWTPENLSQNSPRYTMTDPNKNLRASDRWIHDGSYFRFQNVILGYTLPANWSSKIGLSKVRAYVNVQNLYTITSYPFLDPEVIGSNSDGATTDTASGVDVGSAPTPRTIMLGLNINF
jgi:TonB-linked SusC/RagA family outer membrane protein